MRGTISSMEAKSESAISAGPTFQSPPRMRLRLRLLERLRRRGLAMRLTRRGLSERLCGSIPWSNHVAAGPPASAVTQELREHWKSGGTRRAYLSSPLGDRTGDPAGTLNIISLGLYMVVCICPTRFHLQACSPLRDHAGNACITENWAKACQCCTHSVEGLHRSDEQRQQ